MFIYKPIVATVNHVRPDILHILHSLPYVDYSQYLANRIEIRAVNNVLYRQLVKNIIKSLTVAS